jgi:hypothetical protein
MLTRRSLLAAPAILLKSNFKLATFQADITPPLKTPLCYGLVMPGEKVDDPLHARGVVIFPEREKPIVLCALDWLGVGNQSHDRWREALAAAAGTDPSRVAVHTVHQHDAPGDDISAEEILASKNLSGVLMSKQVAHDAIASVVAAIRSAKPGRITHYSSGKADVENIASNRRVLDADGKVIFGRMTACRNSPHCDAPEGVIDPKATAVSFWDGSERVATLAYYATHPMSHYARGAISADFPGMARKQQDVFTVYFTGAAGNIGAGKYNTGAPENRAVLAKRLADGIKAARANENKYPLETMRWTVEPVALPHREGPEFTEEAILRTMRDTKAELRHRASAGRYLAWLRLTKAGRKISLSALHIGATRLLHLPGELFVEYQIGIQKDRPTDVIAMAAYGDYGPMYIGTMQSYHQGGYETTLVSRVSPEVECVLKDAILELARGTA